LLITLCLLCIFISTVTNPATLQLSDASGVPYYRQVVDQMAAQIRSGALPAGSPLPSVRRLAVELKVSVITTRRAYADLEAAGLVLRRQGRGTFVAETDTANDWAQKRAAELLSDAIDKARELGLEDDAIRAAFDTHLEDS
jgi:GntR family transcriptional regulator